MISNTVRRSLKMLSWFLFLMMCLLFGAVQAKAEPQLALFTI